MRCNRCYEIVENNVGGAFRRYGRLVARHPWKIIIAVVAVNLLLGLGMLRLHEMFDILVTYTPMNSKARKTSDKLQQMFPDLSASDYRDYQMPEWGRMAEIIVQPNGGNILDVDFLREVKKLYDFVLSIQSTDDDGNAIELSQICARKSGACAVDGSFFFDDAFLAQVTAKTVPFPYFFNPSRGPIYYEQLVGEANVSSGLLHSATMLFLKVNLRSDSDHYVELAEYWQDTFIDNIEDYQSDSFDIAYAHRDSISLELNKTINRDLGLSTITFTLMIIYACAATLTARIDCVGQRCILGIGGVMAAGLSLLASFGISSACGVDYVSIVGVIPFLILGIGVDDMFLLMSGMAETNFADDVETRIGDTMATSGISITITSLTDLLAFAAGASSVFPGVRNFCIYCSVAVVFCYVNQASMFLACLAINEHRTADNRHFATCRIVPTREEAEDVGKSRRYVVCCTGRKSRDISETYSMLDHIPRWLIPKLVIPVYMKFIVLIVFAGYMGASVYGITQMEEGLNLKQLVADDSYYMKFANLQERNFPFVIPVSVVFESSLTYSDSTVQGQIETLLQNVKSEPTMKDDFEIHWLRSYQQYAGYDESSETAFISGLKSFLNMTSNKRFENDIVFDDTRNLITYSRVYVMSVSIKDSQEQGKLMTRIREIAAESSLPVFVHSGLFVFFEQYVTILPQTLQTVGVAIVAVLIVTCIFMPHPLMIAFITITVIMITTGIFGFHYYIDRTLSSITMILIIMSVGFSVDFSAHICHGYMISSGRDRNERTKNAILRSGAPIFHGAMSTLIGVSVLAAGHSFTSITFFKVMVIVLVFAIAHALLLLPVILSLFGPNQSENKPRPVAAKKKGHYARRKHIEQDMRVSNSSYKASPFIVNPQLYSHPPRHGYPYYPTYASQAPHENDAPPRYGYPYYPTYASQAPHENDAPPRYGYPYYPTYACQAPHENDAPPRYGYPYYPTYASQAPHENDAPPRYGYPYYPTYASKAPHENDAPWLSYRHWYPAQYYPNWPNYQQYSYP